MIPTDVWFLPPSDLTTLKHASEMGGILPRVFFSILARLMVDPIRGLTTLKRVEVSISMSLSTMEEVTTSKPWETTCTSENTASI